MTATCATSATIQSPFGTNLFCLGTMCSITKIAASMDEFLSQLDVSSNTNIDELPAQFARVMSWMNIHPYSEPDAHRISILLRAALFLHGNLEVHGPSLENKLKDCQLIPKNELHSLLSRYHDGTFLSNVCEQLLMTVTGPNHILEIQDFCCDFLDESQFIRILTKVRDSRSSSLEDDRVSREAKFLIISTFELPSQRDIELTIDRIIDNVEFDVLAWIINQQESLTYFHLKCLIVLKELCSRLENGLVSKQFTASMFEISAIDEEGLSTYLKCLQNKLFANSLMTFFINYLNSIEVLNPNADQARYKQHDPDHLSFLIAGMMSRKSDCRIEFYTRLANIDVNVLQCVRHFNFFYDF